MVLVGYGLTEDDALIRFVRRQFAEDGEDAIGKHVFYIYMNEVGRQHELSQHLPGSADL